MNECTNVNNEAHKLLQACNSQHTDKHTIPRVCNPLLNVQALDQREYRKGLSTAYAVILNPKNSNAQLPYYTVAHLQPETVQKTPILAQKQPKQLPGRRRTADCLVADRDVWMGVVAKHAKHARTQAPHLHPRGCDA